MIVAVDIGGTKTLVASFHGARTITNEERFPTPPDRHDFLKKLLETLKKFDVENAQAICVAVPGMVTREGKIIHCGNLSWDNFDLKNALSKVFDLPIFIHNDAKLAGLAETHSLPEVPALSMYITISTGIGTGIITHGRLDDAFRNSEGGHMMLQTPKGFRVWEDFASGQSIRQDFHSLASDIHDPAEWREIVDRLALGFQTLVPLLQPQVIIIGGSVGTYFERYGALLREVLRHRLPPFITIPEIVQAQHPEEAVVYGCYYYATHQTTESA